MCRNSVQERSRMKKKIVIFLLAVFLVFALLVSALCFFAPQKNQNSRENTTEQQKTEDAAEQTEKEKREQYHFTNLEYIYYINSENETDFEEQAAEYVEKNYKNVQWINALAKFDDDVSSNTGTATFYLQLDDEDNSVVLISYDKKKEIFSFVPYKKQIENIEDYGGMPQEKNTMQDIRLTSEVYYKEKSLEGRSRADIEEIVLSQAQIIVDELGLHNEVELIGARVYGSRSRESLYRPDSDVDVVLSYQGPISEDSFFNYLKEDMLYVKEIPIDINPISKTKSGTLPEYLERAEYYLDEKKIEQFAEQIDTFGRLRGDWYVDETMEPEKAVDAITDDILQKKTGYLNDYLKKTIEISGDQEDIKQAKNLLIQMEKLERLSIFDKEPEPIPEVDFYVAECSEFPSLGEYHEGLSIDEAIAVYEKIPGDRKNGIKAIGINLHFPEGHMYSDKCDLLAGGHICKEMLDAVPFYKENRQVRKAVRYLEKHFEKKENLSLIKPKKKQKNYHL